LPGHQRDEYAPLSAPVEMREGKQHGGTFGFAAFD